MLLIWWTCLNLGPTLINILLLHFVPIEKGGLMVKMLCNFNANEMLFCQWDQTTGGEGVGGE